VSQKAFQDYYTEDFSHCYGCGRLNEHGLQIKSYWDSDESVAKFLPNKHHISVPGFVYGGLIASLIDCHCVGTAAAAIYKTQDRSMDSKPALKFVTASLKVDYIAPTPLGTKLEIRGKIVEIKGKKIVVDAKVIADNKTCATGNVVVVQMPDSMKIK